MKLSEACEKYIASQKEKGQRPSSLGTIQRTLKLLISEMGEDKDVEKILPVHVDKFFKSEAATMQHGKDGLKPRAEASVLQIRRIVRMAILYWKETGLIDRLPLPTDEKEFLEKKGKKPAKPAEKNTTDILESPEVIPDKT